MLIILSPTLAKNYAAQFASTESGLMRARITPIVNLSGVRVQNAFCPNDDCEAQVNQVLLGAKREIVYMQFAFTSERLTRTLENAKARGIKVEGICDGGQWNTQGGKCSRLQARSWDLPNMMHHKVFIVDGKTVITGSYNPTNSGTFRNSENILVITDSAIAAEYRLEYEKALIESTIRRK